MQSVGDKIFDYSKLELERMADAFIRNRPYLDDMFPLQADYVLRRMPDVERLRPSALLLQKNKVVAMVLCPQFMHHKLTVLVDQGTMNDRDGAEYNMALAEEIGHIELHRSVILDIESEQDFVELQRHPRWSIAEHDAKFFGRAFLMPSQLLERLAQQAYRRVANEIGFDNPFVFDRSFTVSIATSFEIPPSDAQKRIDSYSGGLRSRLDSSIAVRSDRLLSVFDEVVVKTLDRDELYGDDPALHNRTRHQ